MTERPSPDERRFRALASGSLERIAELDSFGRTVYTSPDGIGADGMDRVHSEDRPLVAEGFRRAYGDGSCERMCFRTLEEDGSVRWAEVTLSPFDTGDGRHVLVVSRDVTETHLTEQQLRESRERFQRIAETAYDMIVECNLRWEIVYYNERVEEIMGVSNPSHFERDHVHPDDIERVAAFFTDFVANRPDVAQATFRIRHSNGSWRWLEVSLRPLERKAEEPHTLLIGRDVTAQMEAEQRVRESEQRYRDLVESAPLGIFVVREGRVVFVNPAGAEIAGARSQEDLLGRLLSEMLTDGDHEDVSERMRKAPVGAHDDELEFEITGLDGRRRRVQGAASLTSYGGEPAFQSILRDVTDLAQSRLERERLQLQLQEARKLEGLGVLAGGIAHDFNNLLAVILTNVRYARDEGPGRPEGREALVDAEEAAEGAARLVRQLLAYAGRREPEVKSIELTGLVESISDLLSTAAPQGVSLDLDLSPEPLRVFADLVQLEQVLMNLVLNATEAMAGRPGTVTVRTMRQHYRAGELAAWHAGGELSDGDYACLEVSDSGTGMSEEVLARIFDPFFTTKPEGHGLGLSAVFGLVQGHRGAIEVESAPGRGTRIRIALPLETERSARLEGSGAFVLVADRDTATREQAAAMLESLGARVCAAADAEGALGLWAMHGEELDAALVEAELAAPDSPPLAEALHDARPELPIWLLHGPDVVLSPELRAQAAAALPRPCEDAALRERLAELLYKCGTQAGS